MAFGFSLKRVMFGQKGFLKTVDANYVAAVDYTICDVVSRFNIDCMLFSTVW